MTLVFGFLRACCSGSCCSASSTGAFYALLSLSLAIIFGLLRIINFAHGAQYMLGACRRSLGLNYLGVSYWVALVLSPLLVAASAWPSSAGCCGACQWDHLYGLLLTFGLALIVGAASSSCSGCPARPTRCRNSLLRRLQPRPCSLPTYRAWVIVAALVVCLATWYVIERTRLGSYLRAGTENPS